METGLPLGVNWYVNGSGLSGYESSQANLLFSLANGTYSFTVTNLTSYYTTTTHFTVVISGKNVTENVDYYHWAYITGSISPVDANLDVNGKSVSLNSSGLFNITVPNGTYHVIISSSGYISYYINFSLNSGNAKNLIVSLVPISSPSVPSNTELYAIIGIVVAIVVIGAAIVLVNRKK
jgi:subtilase family serine protease